MKRTIAVTSFLMLIMLPGYSQQLPAEKTKRMMDSVKAAYLDIAALKNPVLRQAGVSYEVQGSGRISSRLYDSPYFRGRLQATRVTAFFNVPIAHFGRNILSAGFAGRQQHVNVHDVESLNPSYPVTDMSYDKYTVSSSFSLTRLDTLFHRPAIFSASAAVLTDPETWQYRFIFTGLVAVTLKQTPTTSFSAGLLLLLDPTAPLPVIPFIRYYHKFTEPRLELFFDPSRVALRKELSPKHFLWLSNDIGGNVALFEIDHDNLPRKSIYTTLELKSGLTYEYRMTRKLVLSISGGVSTTATSKILEENKNSDPYVKNKQNMVPYLQAGISCLPFWKGLTR
jgi:hypothetical protein